MVHTASRGTGAKASCPQRVRRSTAAQAPSGSGCVPPLGRHRTTYVPSTPPPASRTVTVSRSPSGAGSPARAGEGDAASEASTATSAAPPARSRRRVDVGRGDVGEDAEEGDVRERKEDRAVMP